MKPKNAVMLLLTSLIWGTAFVAQSVGMDFLEPFTFNGVRSFIGGVTLLPCIWLLEKMNGKPEVDGTRKDLIQGGIACGLLLFAASSLQQMGIQYTTAGKAGFITAFYIVFVPVLGIFLKKAAGWKVWMSVFLALIGLYFLCIKEGFSIGKGDIMIFACALVFAVHILVIDYYSPKVDGVKMSCIQFFVCGIASLPFMFLTETPQIGNILDADFICGSHVLWGGIYITDPRTEACESGDRITAFKYGILFFRTFRLDNIRRNTVSERRNRLCVDVCGNYTCTASGQERKIKKWAGIKGLCKYKRQERENEIRNSESVRK